ncbi:MAG: hypothetical protein LBV67_12570 [Streptococcaceae bacterium]|jgi:hypothetical protein|nr:hypothetical protein [Streptococcaceae bacterium]
MSRKNKNVAKTKEKRLVHYEIVSIFDETNSEKLNNKLERIIYRDYQHLLNQ